MKKHIYRAKNVNKINWDKVAKQLSGEASVFAIDVAKEKQSAHHCMKNIAKVGQI